MAEVTSFRLTGWPAAVVAVGVLAWSAWGFAKHLQPVPAPAREALQAWLVDDYTTPDVHHHLGLTSGASGGVSGGEGSTVVVRGLDLTTPPPDSAQVTIESLGGHGWKDFMIARAQLAVRAPDQRVVHAERYLSLSHGLNGRWTVLGESSAWNYWYALVPAPRNGSSWP